MISVVLGTLNRLTNVKNLIKNTVDQNDFVELVLVDGGSTDGTLEYVKSLSTKNIKLIEYGKRSSYSHFTNLAIQNSTYEYVCQWDDDAILLNPWQELIDILQDKTNDEDFFIFNWKLADNIDRKNDKTWLQGNSKDFKWNLHDESSKDPNGEVIMNYGIYKKKIFREIGMNNTLFDFWYADSDLSNRAYKFGYKHRSLYDMKVLVLDTEKKRDYQNKDLKIYRKNLKKYDKRKLPKGTALLVDN